MQPFGVTGKGLNPGETAETHKENSDVQDLKKMLESAHYKLESANNKIAHLEQSAGSSQGSPSRNIADMQRTMSNMQNLPLGQHGATYAPNQQLAGGYGGNLSPQPPNGYNGAWDQNSGPSYMSGAVNSAGPSAWNPPTMTAQGPSSYSRFAPQPQRPNNILLDSFNQGYDTTYRRGSGQNRASSGMGPFGNGWNASSYPASVTSSTGVSPPMTPGPYQGMRGGLTPAPLYQQRSMGASLSSMGTDFSADSVTNSSHVVNNPWNAQVRDHLLFRSDWQNLRSSLSCSIKLLSKLADSFSACKYFQSWFNLCVSSRANQLSPPAGQEYEL